MPPSCPPCPPCPSSWLGLLDSSSAAGAADRRRRLSAPTPATAAAGIFPAKSTAMGGRSSPNRASFSASRRGLRRRLGLRLGRRRLWVCGSPVEEAFEEAFEDAVEEAVEDDTAAAAAAAAA